MSNPLQPFIDPDGKLVEFESEAPVVYLALGENSNMLDKDYCFECANLPAIRPIIREGRPHIEGEPFICCNCGNPIISYYGTPAFIDIHGHLHSVVTDDRGLVVAQDGIKGLWEYGHPGGSAEDGPGYLLTWKKWAVAGQESGDPGSILHEYEQLTEERAAELRKSFDFVCLRCMQPYWDGHVCDEAGAAWVERSHALAERWHTFYINYGPVFEQPGRLTDPAHTAIIAEIHQDYIKLYEDAKHPEWNAKHVAWLKSRGFEVKE